MFRPNGWRQVMYMGGFAVPMGIVMGGYIFAVQAVQQKPTPAWALGVIVGITTMAVIGLGSLIGIDAAQRYPVNVPVRVKADK